MPISRVAQDEIYASEAEKAARRSTTRSNESNIRRVNVGPTNARGAGSGAPSSASRYSGADDYIREVRNFTASLRSGGAGGGGGGGGGGGLSASSPAIESDFDLDEIKAALAAISAQFAYQRGELRADSAGVRRSFRNFRQGLLRAQDEANELTAGDYAGRGVLRSGLYLERIGEIASRTQREINEARAEKDARLSQNKRRTGRLRTQEKHERASTARGIAREQAATQEELARALRLA